MGERGKEKREEIAEYEGESGKELRRQTGRKRLKFGKGL